MGFTMLPKMAMAMRAAQQRQQPTPVPMEMPWARPSSLGPGPRALRPAQVMAQPTISQMFAPSGPGPQIVGPDPRAWRSRVTGGGSGQT